MKILSKFHDYYDTAAAYGVSDQYWQRAEEHTLLPLGEIGYVLHNASVSWDGDAGILLFCGQIYAVIHMKSRGYKGASFLVANSEDFTVYSQMYQEGLNVPFGPLWPALENNRRYVSSRAYAKLGFEAFQRDVAGINAEELHRQFNSPVILLSYKGSWPSTEVNYRDIRGHYHRKVTVTKDVNLKELGFQRLKDAFTAYQEIDSYLSGVLGVQSNPTVEISDVHRLEGHGFDKVKSFRNMKR